MATDPGTLDFLFDQLGRHASRHSTKRMFGEYCLYRDGLPIALVCGDVLFVKDTADGRAAIESVAALEFGAPYPGAKPHLRLAPDRWDDGEWLADVLARTAAALPTPKPRRSGASTSTGPAKAGATKKAAKKVSASPRPANARSRLRPPKNT